MTARLAILAGVLAGVLSGPGCVEQASSLEPGPEMRPGWNCLSCHREGGEAGTRIWSAGGTVVDQLDDDPSIDGVEDVDVLFFDPSGQDLLHRVRTNRVGNFFNRTPLPGGFRVGVERDGRRVMMPTAPPAGSCNACHATRPIGGALGPIRAP